MKDHPTDDLARLLGRLAEVEPGPGVVDRALERTRSALAGAAAAGQGDPSGNAARHDWRHPRLAAVIAAAATVACVAAALLAFFDFGHASAFAQVQSAIRGVSWVAFSVDVVEAAQGTDAKPSREMLDLSGDRARTESTDGSQVLVIDNRRRETMFLRPRQNLAVLQPFSPESKLPPFRDYFDKLRYASAEGVQRLPDVELDGRRVNRYRAPQGVFEAGVEFLVFVDPQTQLPVRVECVVRDSEGRRLLQVVCKDFSYEPLDPTLFDLVPPAGYRVERPPPPPPPPVEVAPLAGPSTPVKIELRLAESAPRNGLMEAAIGDTGQKVFLYPQPVVTRRDMESARLLKQEYVGLEIEVTLTKDGGQRLAEATSKNVGKRLAVLVDGRLIAAPKILNRISGKFLISGITAEEASKIVRSFRPTP